MNNSAQNQPQYPLTDKSRRLRVLLLEPLFPPQAAWGNIKSLQGYLPPMGVISVYTWLKHRGYYVDFLDTQFGDFNAESLKAHLKSGRYDVVGISVYTPTADYAFQTARLVKAALPDCKIVMGNIHVTMLPELSMRQCPETDFIIRHEGEYTMDEFLSELAGGNNWQKVAGLGYREGTRIAINPPRPFIDNLDHLPLGFYADLDLTRYVPHVTQYVRLPHYSVMTQRGCPNACTYCGASKILGKKIRFYSPNRIVEELKILKFEKKARGFYFQDSTFTMNRDFVVELMWLMIEAKLNLLWSCNTRADRVDPGLLRLMYQAGGRQIAVGVESANQASLDMIKKNTTVQKQTQGVRWMREAGFRCNNSFIICLPGEDDAMVRNTIRYAKKLKSPLAIFWLPVPYPGTELYETCKADGGLRPTDNWNDFLSLNFDNPVYVNPKLGLARMRYWHKRANFEYYTYPLVWRENLKFINSRDDFRRIGQGILILIEMFSASILHMLANVLTLFRGKR